MEDVPEIVRLLQALTVIDTVDKGEPSIRGVCMFTVNGCKFRSLSAEVHENMRLLGMYDDLSQKRSISQTRNPKRSRKVNTTKKVNKQ